MSIQDYLHEKAEESRHNEIIAYMIFLAGSVFFVGGILSSLGMGREPSWFLFIPYPRGLHPSDVSGDSVTSDRSFNDLFGNRRRSALLPRQRLVHARTRQS